MALLSVIRGWRLRDGMAIREKARRTGLSRNALRKYLSNGEIDPRYPDRQSPSKLDDFADKLAAWIKTAFRKGRKQRRNLRQIHADLVALGYRVATTGSPSSSVNGVRCSMKPPGPPVVGAFAPGEAFQFDRSEDWAVIGGESTRLQVAPFKLSQSRAFLLRAYPLQTHEMLFDACNHAFAVLGGDLEDYECGIVRLGSGVCGSLGNFDLAVDEAKCSRILTPYPFNAKLHFKVESAQCVN